MAVQGTCLFAMLYVQYRKDLSTWLKMYQVKIVTTKVRKLWEKPDKN